MRTQMDSPLLEKENSKSSNQRSRFALFLVCVLFVSAGVLYARDVPYPATSVSEEPVGELKIQTCVDVSNTCIGIWVQKNWQDHIMKNAPTTTTEDPESPSESMDLADLFAGINDLRADSDYALVVPSDSKYVPLAKIPEICGEIVPPSLVPAIVNTEQSKGMDCSSTNKFGDLSQLGEGGQASVYLTLYSDEAKEGYLPISLIDGTVGSKFRRPIVVKHSLYHVKDTAHIGGFYMEGIIGLAIQQRAPGIAVKTIDIYETEKTIKVKDKADEDVHEMYLVQQPVALADLSAMEKFWKKIPVYFIAHLAITLLELLKKLHEIAGFVHRDIKPPNLFWGHNGEEIAVFFGDLGNAWPIEVEVNEMVRPDTGTVNLFMTAEYVSPEFAIATGRCNYVTNDIWAAMLIVFELYYGGPLWDGDFPKQLDVQWFTKIGENYIDFKTQMKITHAGEMKDAMVPFFEKALSRDPTERDHDRLLAILHGILEQAEKANGQKEVVARFTKEFPKINKKFGPIKGESVFGGFPSYNKKGNVDAPIKGPRISSK